MAEEYISDVLIREATPQGTDKVFIVNNLPKRLMYRTVPKRVIKKDRDGYDIDAFVNDPSGATTEELLDGLERMKSDDSILFPVKRRHVKEALDNIDRYIDRVFPRDIKPPERVLYAERPGDMRSNPIPRSKIPLVNIPLTSNLRDGSAQVFPQEAKASLPVGSAPQLDIEAIKAQAIKEHEETKKAKKREAMAKARAAKKK